MSLKITQRDKKLLYILAVFVLIVGVGIGIAAPLFSKGQELSSRLAEARIEQSDKKQKVTSLPGLQSKKPAALEKLAELQNEFYPETPSMGIDKMMTEMALSHSLVVADLDISMPAEGEDTALADYGAMLKEQSDASGDTAAAEEEAVTYGGVSTVSVSMVMNGTKDNLQAMVNQCAALEPKMRIAGFTWQNNSATGKDGYSLSLALEMYMYQDTTEGIAESTAESTTENTAENTTENEAENTEEQ